MEIELVVKVSLCIYFQYCMGLSTYEAIEEKLDISNILNPAELKRFQGLDIVRNFLCVVLC